MDKVVEFYFNSRRGASNIKKTRRPISEIIEAICSEVCTVEVSLLSAVGFDLEFDLPINSIRVFKKNYKEVLEVKVSQLQPAGLIEALWKYYELFIGLALKLTHDQYMQPFCLYFPGPVIAAACLLVADVLLDQMDVDVNCLDFKGVGSKKGEFLRQHLSMESFLGLEPSVLFKDASNPEGGEEKCIMRT